MVLLKEVTDPERFGVPVFEGERIVRIEEKPRQPKSRYAVTGIYFYDGTVFDRIRKLKPSAAQRIRDHGHQQQLHQRRHADHSIMQGWWTDAGTFESLWHASNMVREKSQRAGQAQAAGEP